MQKQRFKAKQKQEITLQQAWDIVCDHLDKEPGGGSAHCFFIDSSTVHNKITIHSSSRNIIVESTKEYTGEHL